MAVRITTTPRSPPRSAGRRVPSAAMSGGGRSPSISEDPPATVQQALDRAPIGGEQRRAGRLGELQDWAAGPGDAEQVVRHGHPRPSLVRAIHDHRVEARQMGVKVELERPAARPGEDFAADAVQLWDHGADRIGVLRFTAIRAVQARALEVGVEGRALDPHAATQQRHHVVGVLARSPAQKVADVGLEAHAELNDFGACALEEGDLVGKTQAPALVASPPSLRVPRLISTAARQARRPSGKVASTPSPSVLTTLPPNASMTLLHRRLWRSARLRPSRWPLSSLSFVDSAMSKMPTAQARPGPRWTAVDRTSSRISLRSTIGGIGGLPQWDAELAYITMFYQRSRLDQSVWTPPTTESRRSR